MVPRPLRQLPRTPAEPFWAKNVSPVIDSSIKNDKGEFYALPMQMAVTGITYNATVLEKAGVDPSDITSWDDFSDACAKVTATGAACIGASGKENWTVGRSSTIRPMECSPIRSWRT